MNMDQTDVHKKYKADSAKGIGGHENDADGLPSYIKRGSPEEAHWRQSHPMGQKTKLTATFSTGSTEAHQAAKAGSVTRLEQEIKKKQSVVHQADENGWTPLHEGARGGHLDVVKLLVDNGADVNHKTSNGATVLWWAKQTHGDDHPVVQFLEELGALADGPEL